MQALDVPISAGVILCTHFQLNPDSVNEPAHLPTYLWPITHVDMSQPDVTVTSDSDLLVTDSWGGGAGSDT